MFDRFGLLEPYRQYSQIIEIDGNILYLGDYSAAMDVVQIKVNNIKSILSLVQQIDITYNDLNHKVINIKDDPGIDIFQYFDETYHFIDQGLKNGSVLVHCSMGISRSPTIIIAYIMMKFKYTFSKSYNYVRKKRPIICPNFGFTYQLKQYEKLCIQQKILPEVAFKEFKCPSIKKQRLSYSFEINTERKQQIQNKSVSNNKKKKINFPKLQPKYQHSVNFVSFNMIKELVVELKTQR